MDMGATLDGRDHRHADIGYVFQNLNALVMDLAPYLWIRYVFEGLPIDADHEVPASAGEDYDLIRPILGNPVEGVNNFRMGLGREGERPPGAVELYAQPACGVSCQLDTAV